jgi:hypothetical protein
MQQSGHYVCFPVKNAPSSICGTQGRQPGRKRRGARTIQSSSSVRERQHSLPGKPPTLKLITTRTLHNQRVARYSSLQPTWIQLHCLTLKSFKLLPHGRKINPPHSTTGMPNSVSTKGHLNKQLTVPGAITWVGKIIIACFY